MLGARESSLSDHHDCMDVVGADIARFIAFSWEPYDGDDDSSGNSRLHIDEELLKGWFDDVGAMAASGE